jgi:hypothetical protein
MNERDCSGNRGPVFVDREFFSACEDGEARRGQRYRWCCSKEAGEALGLGDVADYGECGDDGAADEKSYDQFRRAQLL